MQIIEIAQTLRRSRQPREVRNCWGKTRQVKTNTQWRHYNAMATPMSIEHGSKQILIFILYSCGNAFPMSLNADVVNDKTWGYPLHKMHSNHLEIRPSQKALSPKRANTRAGHLSLKSKIGSSLCRTAQWSCFEVATTFLFHDQL